MGRVLAKDGTGSATEAQHNDPMFKDAAALWKTYTSLTTPHMPSDDPRHDLAAEVSNRLRHLDIIVECVKEAIRDIAPDPDRFRVESEYVVVNHPRLRNGEITIEEYFAGIEALPSLFVKDTLVAWDKLWIFTESFYFSAWRLSEIFNQGNSAYRLPHLPKIKARLVNVVRNNLIQHPEQKGSQDFTMSLVVTQSGPVLRSRAVVLRSASGHTEPSAESKDQGMYTAAEELRRELETKIGNSIESIEAMAATDAASTS